jgi:pimeloyl-ACP methyl ester carboxylesterase
MIPGARLVVVNGGPHFISWTHVDEVNAALLSFLKEEKKLELTTPA